MGKSSAKGKREKRDCEGTIVYCYTVSNNPTDLP